MSISHTELECVARQLCESSRGKGAYDAPKCHRNHWRTLATVQIDRARSISTADALMAVFGLKMIAA